MSNPLKKTMVYLGLADEELEPETTTASTPTPVVQPAPAPAPKSGGSVTPSESTMCNRHPRRRR
ncbi:hypothetical protein GCM10025870_03780 [Agromyces marinus]|uniref:Uncharacterized protein n=1 Tax=Agromyces marinus TaxID=1389020 RepID=A0ABN6Y7G8_9MICO|nr:hypothetical protein GCM10025870_03780 [Agromyces marinus]